MKRLLAVTLAVWGCTGVVLAQTKAVKPRAAIAGHDQPGMTCAQILGMSSADWVAQSSEKAPDARSAEQKKVQAIAAYGKCYDARTDRLGASLGKSAKGPSMGARGNFRDLQKALEAFTSKALAASEPPADAVKTAYARLYEMQFRYGFYHGYERNSPKSPAADTAGLNGKSNSAEAVPAKSASSAPVTVSSASAAPGDANPVSLAKNHFGEILNSLPEDKRHELHAAFGDIVSRSEIGEETRLAIYRYAIFLFESSSDRPFSPAPF
jgi:hypothetical protein